MSETKKGRLFGWLLVVSGTLLICSVIYGVVGEFTYFNVSEPLRSALISGEVERVRPTSTLILMSFMYLFEAAIGIGILYTGIKKIKKLAFKSSQLSHRS